MGRGHAERRVQRQGIELVGRREASTLSVVRAVVFDFDGTLVDSDEALAAPFVALGVPRDHVTFGHVVADECRRLGVDVEDYLARYDPSSARPFPGVDAMVRALPARWAVCSNKVRAAGAVELARLDWHPEVALFAEEFAGAKQLGPVLDALALDAEDVLFVGDTAHDRACAHAVGARFALAAWNPRARESAAIDDIVLDRPDALLDLLRDVGRV